MAGRGRPGRTERPRTRSASVVVPFPRASSGDRLELASYVPSGRSLLVGFAVFGAVLLALVVARETSLFAVRSIDVSGAGPGVERQVERALRDRAGKSLFGLDLDIHEGEIVALLGTNGAGKSTLFKCITGLLPPTRGSVRFGGEDLRGLPTDEIAGRGVVMMPGGKSVFPTLTVRDNLRLACWLKRKDKAAVAEAEERVLALFPRLADRIDQMAGNRLASNNSDDPAHPIGWPLSLRSWFNRHRQTYGNQNAFRHMTMADAASRPISWAFSLSFCPSS